MSDDALSSRRVNPAGLAVAVLLLVAAAFIFTNAMSLEITSTYGLGPKAMPMIVAAGLAILGMCHGTAALRGLFPKPETADRNPVLLILGGYVLLISIIGFGGGFIPATAILFATTATAFGRRAILTDLVIGLVLGIIVFILFDKLLTLSLPAGPLENLMR